MSTESFDKLFLVKAQEDVVRFKAKLNDPQAANIIKINTEKSLLAQERKTKILKELKDAWNKAKENGTIKPMKYFEEN